MRPIYDVDIRNVSIGFSRYIVIISANIFFSLPDYNVLG